MRSETSYSGLFDAPGLSDWSTRGDAMTSLQERVVRRWRRRAGWRRAEAGGARMKLDSSESSTAYTPQGPDV